MADSNVHVGEGGSKHKLKRVLLVLGAVLLVAVVSLSAGVGLRWWQQQREYSRLGAPATIAKEATEAQELAIAGDFTKAHETINKALENPKLSPDAKYDLYIQRGVIYENEQQLDKAMESYRKAESIKQTFDVVQTIARLLEAKGDKAQAIEYYKKAITLIPEDEAMKDAMKKYYENVIIVLEGGQPNYE